MQIRTCLTCKYLHTQLRIGPRDYDTAGLAGHEEKKKESWVYVFCSNEGFNLGYDFTEIDFKMALITAHSCTGYKQDEEAIKDIVIHQLTE